MKGSYILCKKIRILREYTRYCYKLVSCRSSEKNRYQNALAVCNVALDSVVSDNFGKSSTSINHEEIASKLLRSLKSKENAVQLLTTSPGVKYDNAVTIISKIGVDMSQFCSSKHLCCWAGLMPGSNETDGKKKSVRIMRAGVYLKPALVQCAHAAVKSDKSPYYKKKYESLVKCRGKKRAIIAIARMIPSVIYYMLSSTFFHTIPHSTKIKKQCKAF